MHVCVYITHRVKEKKKGKKENYNLTKKKKYKKKRKRERERERENVGMENCKQSSLVRAYKYRATTTSSLPHSSFSFFLSFLFAPKTFLFYFCLSRFLFNSGNQVSAPKMVADKPKKSKPADKLDVDEADHIDVQLVHYIEKLQEVQDELEKVTSLPLPFPFSLFSLFTFCMHISL